VPVGYKYGDLALQVGGISNLGQYIVMSPEGLGPEDDFAGEAQQQLYTIDQPSRQRDVT
jgi:hypothetical protein